MKNKKTLTSDYFSKIYASNDDPWNFETSEYETEKYATTIEALPREHYSAILEIGCSIGVFTKKLSQKCQYLLALDISEKALAIARSRCENLEHVHFKKLSFPNEVPNTQFDLIVISEMAYYLSSEDWKLAIAKTYNLLKEKGEIILVHWLPIVQDNPQTGDEVHHIFRAEIGEKMKNIFNSRAEKYKIDVWEKC